MNHIFCTECGNKIEYSYSKPKFCSSCGSKCGGGSVSLRKPAKSFEAEESLRDDETAVDEVPDIRGLQVETASYGNNVFSFESLVGEKDQNPNIRDKGSRSLEDFIDDKRG